MSILVDYLLCHDDELERRRIAFIIYLVPHDWDIKKDGGALDLFESGPSSDVSVVSDNPGDYHPWRVVKSLSPARNCLAFFEVCSKSFHQASCHTPLHNFKIIVSMRRNQLLVAFYRFNSQDER